MRKYDLAKVPPEALARIQAKAKNRPAAIDNTEIINRFRAEGGHIFHIRPFAFAWGKPKQSSRGMTVAFKVKSGRIELATAIQHRHDHFSKKIGTKTAIGHFDNGLVVSVPLPGNKKDAAFHLKNAFTNLT